MWVILTLLRYSADSVSVVRTSTCLVLQGQFVSVYCLILTLPRYIALSHYLWLLFYGLSYLFEHYIHRQWYTELYTVESIYLQSFQIVLFQTV